MTRMMEGVGTGNEKERLAPLTVVRTVDKPQRKESGSWGRGRGFPLLSILTHVKCAESRQTVSGACAFQCPSLVACCKGQARRRMRGCSRQRAQPMQRLTVAGAGDNCGNPGRDGQTLGLDRGGVAVGLQIRRTLHLPVWVLGWLPGRRDGRVKGLLRTPTVCCLDAWVVLRRVPQSSLGRGGGRGGGHFQGGMTWGPIPASVHPRSPSPL